MVGVLVAGDIRACPREFDTAYLKSLRASIDNGESL